MAKMKNKQNNMTSRGQQSDGRASKEEFGADRYDRGDDSETDSDEAEESNYQAAGSRQASPSISKPAQSNGQASRSVKGGGDALKDFDPSRLLDSARSFVEGHPGRATLIGAAVGAAVAGLFATERGRQLMSAAYSYGRPMIADYARDFVNNQGGDVVDRALPQ